MRPRHTPNPKRQILPKADFSKTLINLAENARYGGNPEHKKNPGDFGLNPPSSPRKYKSLCDITGIFARKDAQSLLKEGFRKGLISVQMRNGWPQNVWAVTKDGVPVEAMLENSSQGAYHGYPLPTDDPLSEEILNRWKSSNA